MREERGHLRGDLVIDEPYTLWGSIAGDVTAVKGSKFYVRGPIYGSLTVLHGGRVHVFGNVTGDLVVKDGAKVIHSGVVGGDCVNQGGRLYVDKIAKTLGDIRTEEGKTTIEGEDETATEEE
jgi:cytoskeletal protein CcmA (bactofilin family)